MDAPTSVSARLLEVLDVAVFERRDRGFVLRYGAPGWLRTLYPEAQVGTVVPLADRFFYLADFLETAERFWQRPDREVLASEVWTETDEDGFDWLLQARALKEDGSDLLLVTLATVDQQAFRSVLQQSRELDLEHYRLRKAIDRREVMLHCLVHDLSTPLAGIRSSLYLLAEDGMAEQPANGDTPELVELGLRQADKMRRLLQEGVRALMHAPEEEGAGGADMLQAAQDVARLLQPTATLRGVTVRVLAAGEPADDALPTDAASTSGWQVQGEQGQLERVLFNLVDNALRYAPPESAVTIHLDREENRILCTVTDAGDGVEEALRPRLFMRHAQGSDRPGTAGLGLYYCRITVEGWGGAIGYAPAEEGGAAFWFRLPPATSSAA